MNNCPIPSGLEKAYSSKIRFEHRNGRDVVVKCVSAESRFAEYFFHSELAKNNLPVMTVEIIDEELVLDFIPNAHTLGDDESLTNFKLFGRAVRAMHNIKLPSTNTINDSGELISIKWLDFIEQTIQFGKQKQIKRNGFSQEFSNKIEKKLRSLNFIEPAESVLLHGDLHPNNVLFANGKTILFDSSDWIISGDKFYDLALIALDTTSENLKAFIKGYGEDFREERKKLNAYILLRAYERHPNPFEIQIPTIVKNILK